jgi:hypothetical protein
MSDVAVIIALVLSSGSLVVSIASFVLAISAKRQAKKAATLGFRVEAINHLRAVLSDIDRGSITSRTVDALHRTRIHPRCQRETPQGIRRHISLEYAGCEGEGSLPARHYSAER